MVSWLRANGKILFRGAALLLAGAAAGFGLGLFFAVPAGPGCQESDLTPVPDTGFASPAPEAAPASSLPQEEPVPEKWVCLTFDDGPSKTTQAVLDALNAVEGIEWIRLLYAYPERITDAFIAAMTRNEKVLHYLDVPIQHINSEMLRAMNRRGDRETVLDALTRLRAAMPDITLRTTLITGYPGETQAQFEELCEFVKDYAFDRLGCFAYSEEEGTVAAGLPQLPQELREQRAEAVMNIQANVMARRQEERVGRTVQVICDGYDDENDLYICRTRADAPDIDAECCVRSETPLEPGAFYRVTIEESDVYDLYGALAES